MSAVAEATRPQGPRPWNRILSWYPILIAVAFAIEPYSRYDIDPVEGLRVLVIAVGLSVLLTAMCHRLLGPDRGAALGAIILAALAAATSAERLVAFGLAGALVVVEARMVAAGTFRGLIPWARVSEALAIAFSIVIALELVQGAQLRSDEPSLPVPAAWLSPVSADRPDIFVILSDGHGRADVLARDYGYDMRRLRSTLESLQFNESPNSHANHVLTRWSFSVLFNGRPLAELGQNMADVANEAVPPAALRGSSGIAFLKNAGYRIVAVHSGFAEVGLMPTDVIIDPGPSNELERATVSETLLGRLLDPSDQYWLRADADRIQGEVDAVESLAREPSPEPLFVFAHLPAPHAPYVFASDCSMRLQGYLTPTPPAVRDPTSTAIRVVAEADQTACVDHLLSQAVRSIVAARPNAVVILLSDHGPDELVDWAAPAEPGLGNRFANLFWARTPGRSGLFPDDVTLVNVLPILFNAYFGTALPLHPDDLFLGPVGTDGTFVRYVPGSPGD